MSALNFIYTKVNHMKSVVKILTLAVGYVLYIPFICFYSYILGPILKAVLIPGGLVLIAFMMGPRQPGRSGITPAAAKQPPAKAGVMPLIASQQTTSPGKIKK